MKDKQFTLSRRYLAALRRHVTGPPRSLQPARKVGLNAVAMGLKIMELAKIHEHALVALNGSVTGEGMMKRAHHFFAGAIKPIIETERTARNAKVHVRQLTRALERRSAELAATNCRLQRGIVRCKSVEAALKQSAAHYTKLLKESLHLQEGLRQLTHRGLVAQEAERKKISTDLQDEVAQTLLGINVRLLSLKQEARVNTKGLKNEIATTQRLVAKSARSVRRVAREFRNA